ncbi:MAG TPA: Rieske 2Fe-2S domain-containing protein [Thermoanaerobaculia bacterium]|jgi:nitrite reductase/ring-hydroxylating ferredoxin subunit|nr:Rieske 2Fe-2S domain-containing protein [Thermoanaerobaculia bacterium]
MPAKSSNSSLPAPAADAFPAYPASWYLFCESRRLRQGPFSQEVLGRRLVAFRTASGKAAVMDARCAHLGADLGCGTVVGETLRCPFHHWRYEADGVCAAVPGLEQPPSFARLRTYPVEERHGHVFFFNGLEPLFPLPFFLGEDPRGYVAGEVFRYVADCTWYMNSAHAFDRQHFAAVHDRELLAPPAIDCPAPYARRNSYSAKVVGHSIFDRFLRVGAGRTVKITLTIWGGTFAVITADFERLRSGFLMAMEPLESGQTLCHGIVCARRAPGPLALFDPLRLKVRRLFTHGYLKEEARLLRSTRYNPGSLGPNDQEMIDFFNWVALLPQSPRPVPSSEGDHESIHRSPAAVVRGSRAGVVANAAAD